MLCRYQILFRQDISLSFTYILDSNIQRPYKFRISLQQLHNLLDQERQTYGLFHHQPMDHH